jgi:hypothetical protein
MGGAMAFMGGLGLSWSDAYIGPLINPIPHWGASFSLGLTSAKFSNLGKLNGFLNIDEGNALISDKQLLPMYVAEFRMGGFRGFPFDLGAKFGMMPAVPLPGMFTGMLESSYRMQVIGGDFRWRLASGMGIGPKISLGFAVNMVAGGYDIPLLNAAGIGLSLNTRGQATGFRITSGTAGDTVLNYNWNATVFDLKLDLGKSFPYSGFTFFGGAKLGFGITKTDVAFTGPNVTVGTGTSGASYVIGRMTAANIEQRMAALQTYLNYGVAVITNESITITYNGITLDVQGHIGISFDRDRMHYTISYMMDVLHFESGFSFSVRYQQ